MSGYAATQDGWVAALILAVIASGIIAGTCAAVYGLALGVRDWARDVRRQREADGKWRHMRRQMY